MTHSLTGREIIDISRVLRPGMPVWPGDPEVELTPWSRIAEGDPANLAVIRCGLHSGTHLDAPYHAMERGATTESLPLDPFIGRATVIHLGDSDSIEEAVVRRALDLFPATERLLVSTGAWRSPDRIPERFAALEPGAASHLLASGLKLFGTDAPSIDPPDSDLPSHLILLGGGVQVLENLELTGVEEGEYELVALPLRLEGGDGSLVRAVLLR